MKIILYLLISLSFLVSCKDITNKNNNPDASNNKQELTFEDVPDNFRYASGINISHKLSLKCDGEYIPVRKRPLTNSELQAANSGTEHAKVLNDSLIIAYLYNEYPVKLIKETEGFYKIRFDYKNQTTEGYIINSFCGKPTITEYSDISNSLKSSNPIINPELLPYCRVYIAEKFHNLLAQDINAKTPLEHFKKVLSQTERELILYGLFVGQSERKLCHNPRRAGGDTTHEIYCINNHYFTYEFTNDGSMFVVISPSLPVQIDSFLIDSDTLNLSTNSLDPYQSRPELKLYPQDNRRAFTSRKNTRWIINDTIPLIDISYIADQLSIPETQIGHTYFYEILEMYIQEVLPKRKDTYLEHYLGLQNKTR